MAKPHNYSLQQDIPCLDPIDVAVCGGGPAGFAAAVAAARLGARTLLIEATGSLGGMATNGLVTAYDPMADGEKCLVGGIMRELMETLHTRKFLPACTQPENWRKKLLCPSKILPEETKLLQDEMILEAGVVPRFFTRVAGVDASGEHGRINGLILCDVSGLCFQPAETVIDCTGDAAVAAAAGAAFEAAPGDTDHVMPATLCFVVSNVEETRKDSPAKYAEQALRDGHFSQTEVRLIPSYMGPGTYSFNAGHIFGLDSTDPRALSKAMMEGRRIVAEHVAYLRRYVPGYEKCILVTTAPLMGVRESRRIRGEYRLTWEDFISARHFPDQIAVYAKEIDIHAYSAEPREQVRFKLTRQRRYGWLPPGKSYGIPYGVLVPRGWKNLWVAGRSVSTDQRVHGSSRVMPAAAMMGEAAGTAAVQALREGETADNLNTERLVETLREQGAYLPQSTLSEKMTRGSGSGRRVEAVCNIEEPSDAEIDEALARWPTPATQAPAQDKPIESAQPDPKQQAKAAPNAEKTLSAALGHCHSTADRNCCRSSFVDADEILGEIERALTSPPPDERRLRELARLLADRLRFSCCRSGLPEAEALAAQLEAHLASDVVRPQ